jgi:hypothetical protein
MTKLRSGERSGEQGEMFGRTTEEASDDVRSPRERELENYGSSSISTSGSKGTDEEPPSSQEQEQIPRDEFGRIDLQDLEPVLSGHQAHAFRTLVRADARWLDVSPIQVERLRGESNGLGDKALTEALIALTYDPAIKTSPAAKLDRVFKRALKDVKTWAEKKPTTEGGTA